MVIPQVEPVVRPIGPHFFSRLGAPEWPHEKIFASRDEFRLQQCGFSLLNFPETDQQRLLAFKLATIILVLFGKTKSRHAEATFCEGFSFSVDIWAITWVRHDIEVRGSLRVDPGLSEAGRRIRIVVPFFYESGLSLARLDFRIGFEMMSVAGVIGRVGRRA